MARSKENQFGGYFMEFMGMMAKSLMEQGRMRTAEAYLTTRHSFFKFVDNEDVKLRRVNADLIERYEIFLREQGVTPNTSSFYMRNLRAVYNRAVDQELTAQKYPFRHVYTGVAKTNKRALPVSVIKQIKNLDLSDCKALEFARDMFMFSFYTRGMSFVDMAYLQRADLRDNYLVYKRKKTRQQLIVKWERPMDEIVRRHTPSGSPFLLPIIKNPDRDNRTQYTNTLRFVNKKLKMVARRLRLHFPLSTYVARHSWASIAKSKDIPVSVISEAMGHDSEKTTLIYLTSLDTSAVNDANRLIMRML